MRCVRSEANYRSRRCMLCRIENAAYRRGATAIAILVALPVLLTAAAVLG